MINFKISIIPVVDSTNTYLSNLAKNKLVTNGTVVIAEEQTNGRGQIGNAWESEANKNLTFSIFLKHNDLIIDKIYYINKLVSISIIDFLNKYNIKAKIKWPNDIYIKNNKISGILIENNIKNNFVDFSIIGIGINVNQEKFKNNRITSIYSETKKEYDLNLSLLSFLEIFRKNYELFFCGDYNLLNKAYFDNLLFYNEWSKFKDSNNNFIDAKIIDIDNFGRLILENKFKEKSVYMNKELSFIF